MIDPRAAIDPQCELGEGVSIGPFSVIQGKVSIGAGSQIGPHVVIKGETTIGRDNHIYQFASIGEDPQDKKYDGEATRLEIGDRNQIREFTTINRGTAQDATTTRIGSDNLFMAYTHVAHDCQIGDHIIMANAASLGGHVKIDDWAILGGFAIVHQFCRIGAHSFAAMGSAILKDIPPYVMVSGNPAKPHGINTEGLKRRRFTENEIIAIKRAYKTLYENGLLLHEATRQIAEKTAEHPKLSALSQFLQSNARSIVR